jgi:hypothetical protein
MTAAFCSCYEGGPPDELTDNPVFEELREVTCPIWRLFGHVACVPFSISALAMMRQSRISGQISVSCCGHLRRPALDECSKAVERLGEIVSGGCKAQAEMRRRVEAIARSQQDLTLGGGLAERSGVPSAHQPGESGHAALRRNPAEYVAMVRHEALEQLEVSGGDFLSLAEHGVAFANCDLRKNLSVVVFEMEK